MSTNKSSSSSSSDIDTVAKLKAHLGMTETDLLTSQSGLVGDILDVKNGQVVIGVLALAKPIIVPIDMILNSDMAKKRGITVPEHANPPKLLGSMPLKRKVEP